jgi:hypothetical protein
MCVTAHIPWLIMRVRRWETLDAHALQVCSRPSFVICLYMAFSLSARAYESGVRVLAFIRACMVAWCTCVSVGMFAHAPSKLMRMHGRRRHCECTCVELRCSSSAPAKLQCRAPCLLLPSRTNRGKRRELPKKLAAQPCRTPTQATHHPLKYMLCRRAVGNMIAPT